VRKEGGDREDDVYENTCFQVRDGDGGRNGEVSIEGWRNKSDFEESFSFSVLCVF
jgi:hypothetical protein